MAQNTPSTSPDLAELVSLFYPEIDDLGKFESVSSQDCPVVHRKLLDHTDHMTVTVEYYHDDSVDVEVVQKKQTDSAYAREILLSRQRDHKVVQYGIMRVAFDLLSDQVRHEIENEGTPLGRILIRHDVLRHVELAGLWRVTPGEKLRDLLAMSPEESTYGRTAMIHIENKPAIELLEIVTVAD